MPNDADLVRLRRALSCPSPSPSICFFALPNWKEGGGNGWTTGIVVNGVPKSPIVRSAHLPHRVGNSTSKRDKHRRHNVR